MKNISSSYLYTFSRGKTKNYCQCSVQKERIMKNRSSLLLPFSQNKRWQKYWFNCFICVILQIIEAVQGIGATIEQHSNEVFETYRGPCYDNDDNLASSVYLWNKEGGCVNKGFLRIVSYYVHRDTKHIDRILPCPTESSHITKIEKWLMKM